VRDPKPIVSWDELESRLREDEKSATERAEAYVRSVRRRRRRMQRASTDRYGVVAAPPLPHRK